MIVCPIQPIFSRVDPAGLVIKWEEIDNIITDMRATCIKIGDMFCGTLKQYILAHEYCHLVCFSMLEETERLFIPSGIDMMQLTRFFDEQYEKREFEKMMTHHFKLMKTLSKTGTTDGSICIENNPSWRKKESEIIAVFYAMLYIEPKTIINMLPRAVDKFLENASDNYYGLETKSLFEPYENNNMLIDPNELSVTF
jgi:hypothetical protein